MTTRGSTAEILGTILAGGASRRMGRDKALLEWGGVPLLERAAATLTQLFSRVIVCGDPDRYSHLPLEVIADRRRGAGPLAGLETALERSAGRPVFVLACDLVRVTPALVEHVVGRAAAADRAAAASLGGLLQPLCGLYRPACREPLAAFLDRGGRRAVAFFESLGGRAVELEPELPFFDPDLLVNLNRPEDLDRARVGGSAPHRGGTGR